MGFYEIVFLISVVFVLIYFVVHSYLLIKFERKKVDLLKSIRTYLIINTDNTHDIYEWLDYFNTKLDSFDLTDFTD